jgi:formyltetrahydrofolate synthetase
MRAHGVEPVVAINAMPGLSAKPAAISISIDLDDDGNVVGLY